MATKLPPHNLGEVCGAVIHVAGNWKKRGAITVIDLMQHIPGPDFPTGGIAYRHRMQPNSDGKPTLTDTIQQAYETGRGLIVTQARIAIEETRGGKADIVVTRGTAPSEQPRTVE